jgi:hypothetical protein
MGSLQGVNGPDSLAKPGVPVTLWRSADQTFLIVFIDFPDVQIKAEHAGARRTQKPDRDPD